MASRQDMLTAMQNSVNAVNLVAKQLGNVFPQATALSTIAGVAGTITFTSSEAVAFLLVHTSSGGIYKIPLYT